MSLHDLPAVNASFNGLAAVFLTAGFIFIRRKNQSAHRKCMIAALSSSILFLTGYLTYHFTIHGVTKFRDPAWFKPRRSGYFLSTPGESNSGSVVRVTSLAPLSAGKAA